MIPRKRPILLQNRGVDPKKLLMPLIISEGEAAPTAWPLQDSRLTLAGLGDYAKHLYEIGVGGTLLLASPNKRFSDGRGALESGGLLPAALGVLRESAPGLVRASDLCVCSFTPEGQCGLVRNEEIDFNATRSLLEEQALLLAASGAELLMVSTPVQDVTEGIRVRLDRSSYQAVSIAIQANKAASALYGTFRRSTQIAATWNDKRAYQLDPANRRESIRSVLTAASTGADLVVLKPSFGYNDLVAEACQRVDLPIGAFCTSGAHVLLANGASQDSPDLYLDRLGNWYRRLSNAGVSAIVSYGAARYAEQLQRSSTL